MRIVEKYYTVNGVLYCHRYIMILGIIDNIQVLRITHSGKHITIETIVAIFKHKNKIP